MSTVACSCTVLFFLPSLIYQLKNTSFKKKKKQVEALAQGLL
jgi:hypothetical protein